MRTTVTLDADVQEMLKQTSLRTGKPFKRVINDAIRAGLKSGARGTAPLPTWPCHDMGPPLVDLTKALALADELDDQRR